MANKERVFALFQHRCRQYLTDEEHEQVKDTIAQFLTSRDLGLLIANLSYFLDTADKRRILPVVCNLLPDRFEKEFCELTDLPWPLEPLDFPPDLIVAPQFTIKPSQPTDQYIECEPSGPPAASGEVNQFDLLVAMAEADLKLSEGQGMEAVNPLMMNASPKSGDSAAQLSRGGFKSASFARRAPAQAQPIQQLDARVDGLPDYVSDAGTRGEAEAQLRLAGFKPGTFLVRLKDLGFGGSFKRKPGVKPPRKAWALSFVDTDEAHSIQHLLIEQQSRGSVLTITGREFGQHTVVHDLLVYLRDSANYPLRETPFQCKRWYHGPIERPDAEMRLLQGATNGKFLVRRRAAEENAYVISLVVDNEVYHNKVYVSPDGQWTATAAPGVKHATLADLVDYHSTSAKGMQHALTTPCPRPQPFYLMANMM